jgi:hypothetical protein
VVTFTRRRSAAQVVLRTATQWRLIEAKHAPTHCVAIAAVARGAVVALHRVLADKFEESVILFLECGDDLTVLSGIRIGERAAKEIAAHFVG